MADNLEALSVIFDSHRGRCKRLETLTRVGKLRLANVDQVQEIYAGVDDLRKNLNTRLEAFIASLPVDEEDEPILPVNGQEGYRFRDENTEEVFNRIEETLKTARRALVKFKAEQDPGDAALIREAAICNFLQGGGTEEVILRRI